MPWINYANLVHGSNKARVVAEAVGVDGSEFVVDSQHSWEKGLAVDLFALEGQAAKIAVADLDNELFVDSLEPINPVLQAQ